MSLCHKGDVWQTDRNAAPVNEHHKPNEKASDELSAFLTYVAAKRQYP